MGIDLLALALDGVMFDTEEAHLRACNAAFDNCEFGMRWSSAQFREAARAWGANNVFAALTERMKKTASAREAKRLTAERSRLFHEFAIELRPALHSGCAQLMEDALASGCKLAVVTDMPAKTAYALLDQAFGDAVNERFAVVVSSATFAEPFDNGPHHLAMRTVGVEPVCCAAIDAVTPGLRSAQEAGIWTISATPYEKNIARVAGADVWCPQLQELRELIGGQKRRAEQFVTFDMLRTMKKHQMHEVPVLRQRPHLQRVA